MEDSHGQVLGKDRICATAAGYIYKDMNKRSSTQH